MKKLLTWLSSNNIRQILGVNLASLAFAVAIVVPQTNAVWSTWEVTRNVPMVTILNGPTESETRWPLTTFGISQNFWVGHPGVDLTAPFGSPVYPITEGTVQWTSVISFGYGNHVFIKNSDQLQSLYAHLSKLLVKAGDTVTKTTPIGLVGATGWATGNHVHLEVYQNGVPVNPEDVLPEIK